MQVGTNTPSVDTTPHKYVSFKKSGGSELKHFLVTSYVYEKMFSIDLRSKRLRISSLNVGFIKGLTTVQIDIERYTDEQKSLYIAGLLEICLANSYSGENVEDKLLKFLFKKHEVRYKLSYSSDFNVRIHKTHNANLRNLDNCFAGH